ncbi:MAG: hypothetical protein ACOCQQ_01560 [Candidatus Nanoarchaeia archaeon]
MTLNKKALEDIKDAKGRERTLKRGLRKTVKITGRLLGDTKKEESAIKQSSQKKELKFDKKLEKDIDQLLHGLALSLRALVFTVKDIHDAEKEQGKRIDKVTNKISHTTKEELSMLRRELNALSQLELK